MAGYGAAAEERTALQVLGWPLLLPIRQTQTAMLRVGSGEGCF